MRERILALFPAFQLGLTVVVAFFMARLLELGFLTAVGVLLGLLGLLALLLAYDRWALPIAIAAFLATGLNVPLKSLLEVVRWGVLGVVAFLGMLWLRKGARVKLGAFHGAAAAVLLSLLLSYAVSVNPRMTLLKVAAVSLLFVYAAFGARWAYSRREGEFCRSILLVSEVLVCLSAVSYWVFRYPVYGNANSLGAVMGIWAFPVLLWGALTADKKSGRVRRFIALAVCAALLHSSLARAALLGAAACAFYVLLALRRHRALVVGSVLLSLGIAAFSYYYGDDWNTILEGVVLKGRGRESVFESRKPFWTETVESIKEQPWFGTGFGATKGLSEEWGGGAATAGLAREHGSSYLALVEGVGVVGAIPAVFLLVLLIREIWSVCSRARGDTKTRTLSIPVAAILLGGLVHAGFEDWLFAAGNYLTVGFWTMAFILVDREMGLSEGPSEAGASREYRPLEDQEISGTWTYS